MDSEQEKSIAWKCRRGMLELDLILTRFLQEKFPTLSAEEQHAFAQLLDEDDFTLAAWLFGGESPPDAMLLAIVRFNHDKKAGVVAVNLE
jgi:antitoxin CptB